MTVIENPFFVNYGFSKAFSTVTNLKQKKLVIVEVGGFKNGHVKLIVVCARVFCLLDKIKKLKKNSSHNSKKRQLKDNKLRAIISYLFAAEWRTLSLCPVVKY